MKRIFVYIFFLVLFTLGISRPGRTATWFCTPGGADPSQTSNWWSGSNGTGTHPSDFGGLNDNWYILSGIYGTTYTVNSAWIVSGYVYITTYSTLLVNNAVVIPDNHLHMAANAIYKHNIDGGALPNAIWDFNSTCVISGVISSVPTYINQVYGNFTWNCPGQTVELSLDWSGNLTMDAITISSTGAGSLELSGALSYNYSIASLTISNSTVFMNDYGPGNYGLTITGALDVNSSGLYLTRLDNQTSVLSAGSVYVGDGTGSGQLTLVGSGNGSATLQVQNLLYESSSSTPVSTANTGTGVVNFNGTNGSMTYLYFTGPVSINVLNGAVLYFGSNIIYGANATFSLNSGGKLIMSGGQGITTAGNAAGFVQTLLRNYSSGGIYEYKGNGYTGNGLPNLSTTPGNLIINNYNSQYTYILYLTNGITITAPSSCVIDPGSSLDMGTNVISGSGGFTLNSNASYRTTLYSGHSNGIDGNIQTATLSLSTAADYYFNGTTGPQTTGTRLPSGMYLLYINNASGVSTTNDINVSFLYLTAGTFNINSSTLTVDPYSIIGNGPLLGTSASTLIVNGAGSEQICPGTVGNLVINAAGFVNLSGNFTILNQLTLNGGPLRVLNYTLTLGNSVIAGTPSQLQTTNQSTLIISGNNTGGAIPSTITSLARLEIDNPGGVSLNSNLAISNNLKLAGGFLNLGSYQVTGAASLTVTAGSKLGIGDPAGVSGNIALTGSKSIDAATDYEFNGSVNQLTDFLPTLVPNTIQNLVINNSGGAIVTLNAPLINANGNLDIMSSGDFVISPGNTLVINGSATIH